jgi:hypothetical protein
MHCQFHSVVKVMRWLKRTTLCLGLAFHNDTSILQTQSFDPLKWLASGLRPLPHLPLPAVVALVVMVAAKAGTTKAKGGKRANQMQMMVAVAVGVVVRIWRWHPQ